MARASFATKDLTEGGLGFIEGNGQIVAASFAVHQLSPNKTTGETYDPACALKISIQRMTKDWEPTNDEPITEFISVGSLEKFHPGTATGPDDEDPADGADEDGNIDAEMEGNALFCVEGAKVNKSAKIATFSESLEKAGFKADYLNGYAPHLVGLTGHFCTIQLPRKADSKAKRDPTCLGMDKITVFPYTKGAGAKKAAPASKPAAAGATKKPAAKPAAEEADGTAGDDAGETAVEMLKHIAGGFVGQSVTKAKVLSRLVTALSNKRVPVPQQKPIQDLFRNPDWLQGQAEALELGYEDDVLTVPEGWTAPE